MTFLSLEILIIANVCLDDSFFVFSTDSWATFVS